MAHVLADDLRVAVLQAAFEGKLTKRMSADDDVEELIKRIKDKKTKLINDKEIKRGHLTEEIREEDMPFNIPSSWVWVRFEDLARKIGDGLHGTPEFVSQKTEYPFINGSNLINGRIIELPGTQYVSCTEYENYREELSNNTLLLSINGTIGNQAFYNGESVVFGKSACFIDLLTPLCKEYFSWFLKSDYFLDYASSKATKTTISNLGLRAIRNCPVPLPPLAEQHRIVERVEELMAKIDEYEALEKKLTKLKEEFPEDMKAAILQAAMEGKLTEQLESVDNNYTTTRQRDASDLPDSWTQLRLKDVATHQNGKAFKPSDWRSEGIKIIRIQNLTEEGSKANYCDPKSVEDKFLLDDGDVLVSWSCTIDAYRYRGEKAALNQHIFKVIFNKANVDSQFYIYAIKSLLSVINHQRHGSTMTHITKTDYENLVFPMPPIEEQRLIVEKLDKLLPLCDDLTELVV